MQTMLLTIKNNKLVQVHFFFKLTPFFKSTPFFKLIPLLKLTPLFKFRSNNLRKC